MPTPLRRALMLAAALVVGAVVAGVAVWFGTAARNARHSAEVFERELEYYRTAHDSARREGVRVQMEVFNRTLQVLEETATAAADAAEAAYRERQRIPPPSSTVRDSLRYWRATAEVALREVVLLDSALASTKEIAREQEGQIQRLTAAWLTERARADSASAGLQRLRAELAVLERSRPAPCRIAGLVNCPDRPSSFVSGVGLGLAAAAAAFK